MNTEVYSAIKYLEFKSTDVKFDNEIIISQNTAHVAKWISNSHIQQKFGYNSLTSLVENPFFTFSNDVERILGKPFSASFYWKEVLNHFFYYTISLINSLWFIKDNSLNATQLFLSCDDAQIYLNKTASFLISNCEGTFKNVAFDINDFRKALQLKSKLIAHMPSMQGFGQGKEFDGGTTVSPLNFIDHKTHNRLARAYMFVGQARHVTYLPIKISFYIATLESLFTTDNSEVTHKIKERAAIFISDNNNDRIRIFEEIKKGYDIRSSYMHGGSLKKFDELALVSNNLDVLIRSLFGKIAINPSFFVDTNKGFVDYKSEALSTTFNKMILTGKLEKPEDKSTN